MTSELGTLLIISAPSGAGKSVVIKHVLEQGWFDPASIHFSISHTTRPMRPGETDGRHYHFVTRPEFLSVKEANGFLEHAEVHGNLYGTSRQEVEAHLEKGVDVILDIDVQGARQVWEKKPGAVSVFIYPPSRQELEKRLRSRATETEDSIQTRLSNAAREMVHAASYDYAIINRDVEQAARQLRAILLSKRALRVRQIEELETILRSFDL